MAFSFTPQQQQQPLFQLQTQQQSPFQQSTPFLQQQQQQAQFQLQQQQQFQQQQQHQQFQQQQQQQLQQQLYLFTNDKSPANYSTKWADLHPDSQKVLLQIEERILEYRDESQRLDQCSRLYDSSVSNDGFELDASLVIQELGGINIAMEQQKSIVHELMTNVKYMLRNTEVAIRSFMLLRPRFPHPSKGAASAGTPSQPLGATVTPTASNQPTVFDFYSGLPRKPSPFMQQTVARFERNIGECRQWIEELEQVLLLVSEQNSINSSSSLLESLPKVMSNLHGFFIHVAAKVESIHQYIESMKTAYLADQRRRGDGNDPFIEADRRETAKLEAAARRLHPTLHLPANSQPSTQVAGLLASSANPGALTTPQTAASNLLASSGNPSFGTTATATSSLFSTPATSAPVSSFFGSSGASPQTSLFGSSFSPSPSLFGSAAPAFASTPSAGVSTFATPFASGAALGSGASFGTSSKPRVKSRTGRR